LLLQLHHCPVPPHVVYTLLPAGTVVGIGSSALWTAKSTYIIHIANFDNQNGGAEVQAIMESFFGIVFGIFRTMEVRGNLVSSAVLSNRPDSGNALAYQDLAKMCGANYCPITVPMVYKYRTCLHV
jgi:hypothetical protein